MPDIPVQPPEAKSQFEQILDNIEKFVEKVDMNKVLRALRMLLKVTMIIFPRVVPMKDDERQLYDDIVGGANDLLNPK